MISRRELDGAIRECEDAPVSYQTCEKLATFYTIRDHIEEEKTPAKVEHSYADAPVGDYGQSEFLQCIKGRSEGEIWLLMDELMDTILITNPRLYQGIMRRIKGQM